ncbi:MAG: metallophosphoesterase [Methanobacteriaceae archaeon]|nr:metallophosphoesterase [Methanobacteriaceae archaeon]
MKILTISDIHGKANPNLEKYLENNDIDLVLISGDITDFGPLDFVPEFINSVAATGVDVISIPGNCDPTGICNAINDSDSICIHNNLVAYDDVILFGFGGSNPTPFDTPGEFQDPDLYDALKELFAEYEFVANEDANVLKILLTHAPPFDTMVDVLPDGNHAGSISLRKIIEEFKPDINLCGHIHEAIAKDEIGDTIVLNPGPLEENHAVLIEVADNMDFTANIIDLTE